MFDYFNKYTIGLFFIFSISLIFSFCKKGDPPLIPIEQPKTNPIDTSKINPVDTTTTNPVDTTKNDPCEKLTFYYHKQTGCDGQVYPNPKNSPYILPFKKGATVQTGLTNCSFSYHAAGQQDQYAFDFNMDEGTPFYAARAGTVIELEESHSSMGNTVGGRDYGNFLYIDHGDSTYAAYYHSPKNGIYVEVNDKVEQGQVLGEVGRSGLAGYPHLHFIILKGELIDSVYKYKGIPITFNNVYPARKA